MSVNGWGLRTVSTTSAQPVVPTYTAGFLSSVLVESRLSTATAKSPRVADATVASVPMRATDAILAYRSFNHSAVAGTCAP